MKYTLLFCFLFSLSFSFAQITLDASHFPQEGDTLLTTTDFLLEDVQFDPNATGMQDWDFSSLQAGFIRERFVLDAGKGMGAANFPDAELVVIDGATAAEEYINVTNEVFEVIGYFGTDPVGLGLDLATTLEKPVVERQAPLSFGTVNTSESAFVIKLAWDDLPTQLIDTLINLPITPDSIAVTLSAERTDFIDAFGSLSIPGGEFDVLRQRRIEDRTTIVEAKVPILGWLDVTDLVPFAGLGDITLVSYHFFSDEASEAVAVVNMNAAQDSIQNIVFKYFDPVSSNQSVSLRQPEMAVVPNPAVSQVRFIMENLEPGYYSLRIFNLFGQPVWERRYYINRHRTIREDLQALNAGPYFYSLQNARGELLLTRRLLIVEP
jgi:hypothetical protein